jgi:uncharacterized membrane protein
MRVLLQGLLAGLGVVWLVLLVLSPFAPREAALVYAFAAGICHQQVERSFHLAGTALPVCARCFGLYASGAIAAVAALLQARDDRWGVDPHTARLVFALAAAPTAATVAGEWLGLFPTTNFARFAASLPLGAAAGWLFVRMLKRETDVNTSARSRGPSQSSDAMMPD